MQLSRRERGDVPSRRGRRLSLDRPRARSTRSCGGTASRRRGRRRHRLPVSVQRPDRCLLPSIAAAAPGHLDSCPGWLGCRSRRTRSRRWRRRPLRGRGELLPAHQWTSLRILRRSGSLSTPANGESLAQVSARRAVFADDPPDLGDRLAAQHLLPAIRVAGIGSSRGHATSRSGAERRRPSIGAAAAPRLGGRQGCGDSRDRGDRWSRRAVGASLVPAHAHGPAPPAWPARADGVSAGRLRALARPNRTDPEARRPVSAHGRWWRRPLARRPSRSSVAARCG